MNLEYACVASAEIGESPAELAPRVPQLRSTFLRLGVPLVLRTSG
jgi:hypothetical protein